MTSWLLLIAVMISTRSIATYSHFGKFPWEIGGGGSREVSGTCQVVNIHFYWVIISCPALTRYRARGQKPHEKLKNKNKIITVQP